MYTPQPSDPFVPKELVRRLSLLDGAAMEAQAEPVHGRMTVREIATVEGLPAADFKNRSPFADLVSIDPNRRIRFETTHDELSGRVLDLLTPMGFGQRALVVAPPKAGKTTLLKVMATAVLKNHPGVPVLVLLVDERPEEVTDFRRSVGPLGAEVLASTSDETPEQHTALSEFVLERARRLVEGGKDVVILCDSLTRMARAYNHQQKGNGKILSGGIDARTMEKPRRFFGAARNGEFAGSLTVIATALIDTGSRMDEVIFQEFKGTGNTEIVLDRKLFDRRIFPCLDVPASGTRKEEKLYSADELPKVRALRRALAAASSIDGLTLLIDKLPKFRKNLDFLRGLPSA
jgi:transcription termination factor Rho